MMINFRNKNLGSALAQYAIIIGLLAIVLVPAFYLLGSQVVDYFKGFYEMLGDKSSASSVSTDQPIVSVPVNNTVYTETMSCNGTDCQLQLSDNVTLNISGDLSEIIETSGAAGATEHLASAIDQIVAQAQALDISQEDQQLLYQLADQAKLLAQKEKNAESYSKTMMALTESCLNHFDSDYFNSLSSNAQKNAYVESLLHPIETILLNDTKASDFYTSLYHIGGEYPDQILYGYPAGHDSSGVPEEALMNQFKANLQKLNGSNLNPEIKSIVGVLSQDVEMLAENMYDSFSKKTTNKNMSQLMFGLIKNKLDEPDETMYELEYNLNMIRASFQNVADANYGLTSEQTDLDGKLIEATADKTENQDEDEDDANPDQDDDQNNEQDSPNNEKPPNNQTENNTPPPGGNGGPGH